MRRKHKNSTFSIWKRTLFYVFCVFFLVGGILALLVSYKPNVASASWFDFGWSFRQKIAVTAHTSAENNVYFTPTAFSTSDTTKFQTDCGDLRFTDEHGKVLNYFISSGCGSASTTVHVFVTSFPLGAQDYYMYYGNPSAPNGFSSLDFTTLASGVTLGSNGSEENGSSPIAYWSFDEGQGQIAKDTSSNQLTATLGANNGASTDDPALVTEDQCVSGKCLRFDGSSDYTNAGNPQKIQNLTTITVSAWVKFNSVTAGQYIVSKEQASTPYGWALRINTNGKLDFMVNGTLTESTTLPTANAWYYVVGTYGGGSSKLYVNGTLAASASPATLFNASANVNIGRGEGFGRYLNGSIDEVKIYPYARTAAQVKSDYLVGAAKVGSSAVTGSQKPFLSDGLVGYWKMDEASWTNDCSTGTVLDASGNGNNGKSCPNSTGPTTPAGGKYGSAGSFDATDDYIDAGSGTSLTFGTGDYAISWWSNFASSATPFPVLSYGNHGDGDNSWYIEHYQNNLGIRFYYGSTDQNSPAWLPLPSITYSTWNHYTLVRNTKDRTLSVYLNGKLAHTYTNINNINITNGSLWISKDTRWDNSGKLDEIRIYNRALSADEVRSLYQFAPGPVGYWNFEEGIGSAVNDASGYGNVGTWNGTLGNQWISGKIGKAGNFNGIDNYVNVPYNNSLKLADNGSISLWFKPTTLPAGTHNIISYGGSSYASGYLINQIGSGLNIYWLSLSPSIDLSASTIFTTSTWYHIELVNNNGGLSIYVNGILRGTGNSGGSINSNLATLIGADTANWFTNGQIDDVKIYNYARTQEQILQDMQTSQIGTSGSRLPTPIAWWKFDEGYGTTTQNYGNSGNGFFGTLTNMSSPATSTSGWQNQGKLNKGLAFDGINDNVVISDTGAGSTMDITEHISLSAWIKSSSATNKYILTKTENSFYLGHNITGASNGICFWLNGVNSAWVCTGRNIDDNTWHHVVATYDGVKEVVYVDGVARATSARTGSIRVGNDPIRIGTRQTTDSVYFWPGQIDEVKIYNVALTSDQVMQEFNAGGATLNVGPTANSEASLLSDGAGNPPIAYWNFDEKLGTAVNDISGNNNTGSFVNSPAWDQGRFGSAVRFNGSSNYISLGTSLNATFVTPYSISAWVKPESISNTDQIPIIGGFNGINGSKNYLSLEKNTGKIWLDQWTPNDNQLKSTSAIPLNTWSHIEAIQTSTSRSIYINGVLNVTDSSPETYSGSAPTDWQIGGWSAAGYYFKGSIDELKIYNYARTPAQIAYDFNRGAPIAHYKFDECEGGTIHDSSTNGLHGTWNGTGGGTQTSVGTCNTASTAWGNGVSGKFNSSLNFDGTDDYIQITDTANITHQTGDLSYGTWFKTTNSGGVNGRVLLSKGADHDWLYSTFIVNGQIYCKLYVNGDGGDYLQAVSAVSYNDGNWHHVMCVVSGNTISNYIDGKLVATDNTPSGTRDTSSAGSLYIGAFYYDAGPTFKWIGQIDDVRIYNYALSPTQINTLYNGGNAVLFTPVTGSP